MNVAVVIRAALACRGAVVKRACDDVMFGKGQWAIQLSARAPGVSDFIFIGTNNVRGPMGSEVK